MRTRCPATAAPSPVTSLRRAVHVALLPPLVAACAAGGAVGGVDPGGGTGGGGGAEVHDVIDRRTEEGGALLVAFDDRHALVVVRADGAIVARRELGEGVATDVVVDAARGRILVLLEREEDHARLVSVDWTGEALGAPVELANAAGRARIALLEPGVLVASDADGPRVRLLRDDGTPTRGRALGAPRSWWSDAALREVHGLELPPGGEAIRFTIGVDASGSAEVVERRPLAVQGEEARLVSVAPGDERLVVLDAPGGSLSALAVGPGPVVAGAALQLGSGVGRLEGALGWPPAGTRDGASCGGAPARGLAVVIGEEPALIVATLDGAPPARLSLPGEPPSGSPYGRRDLAVVGEALLVATDAGVVAVREASSAAGGGAAPVLAIAEDRGFAGESLRGPLGCLPR